MDFLLGLLPEAKDILWEKLEYSIKQADSRAAGGSAAAQPGGFYRQWIIDGVCSDQGRRELERLQETANVKKLFASTAERLDDPSFAVSGSRTVKADLREEANSQAGTPSQGAVLPYKFRLVVTENFPGNDPLALPTLPKPKKTAM